MIGGPRKEHNSLTTHSKILLSDRKGHLDMPRSRTKYHNTIYNKTTDNRYRTTTHFDRTNHLNMIGHQNENYNRNMPGHR